MRYLQYAHMHFRKMSPTDAPGLLRSDDSRCGDACKNDSNTAAWSRVDAQGLPSTWSTWKTTAREVLFHEDGRLAPQALFTRAYVFLCPWPKSIVSVTGAEILPCAQ